MIDNIKFKITEADKPRFEASIERNEYVKLTSNFDIKTREASEYPKIGKLQNMEIRVTEKGAVVKGSIHKYYNSITGSGNQNFNDFSFEEYNFAMNDLCEKLQINREETKVTNLEFGFNLNTKHDPKNLVEKHILMYDLNDHNRRDNYRGKGNYKEFKKTDYCIKVYDKGRENSIFDKYILRIELKITGSRYLKKLGIINLNQIGYQSFKDLFKAFLSHFNKIMIVDSLRIPQGIREDQMILYKNCINPNHWRDVDSTEKKETHREFMKLIKKFRHNEIHNTLREKIYQKYSLLMNLKYLQYA